VKVLLHPVALFALVVLVVNDHVLKAQFPGVLTGKLSDVAGMIVAPLVLVAIVRAIAPVRGRSATVAWCAVFIVGAMFALAKTWEPATHAYETTLAFARLPFRALFAAASGRALWDEHIVLVRDATDLIALPFGLVAVWITRQSGYRPDTGTANGTGSVNANDLSAPCR
jgi:hypothetical protein